jgi:acyl transferase domain-containing protein
MLAAGLSEDAGLELLTEYNGCACLSAVNSPSSVTLSGNAETLEGISKALDDRGVFQKKLRVRYAFHSAHMDPIREPLLESLKGLSPSKALLPIYSTVSGTKTNGEEFDANYWWNNIRQPVRFCDGIRAIAEAGFQTFLELGPHPALTASVRETVQTGGVSCRVFHSLRRNENDRETLLKALGNLYASGHAIRWDSLCSGSFICLPGYSWDKEEYWVESAEHRQYRLGPRSHPFLGENDLGSKLAWEVRLGTRARSVIEDHKVQGRTIFPASAYVEIALEAGRQFFGDVPCDIENVEFLKAFFLPPLDEPCQMRFQLDPDQKTFQSYGGLTGGAGWALQCRGEIRETPESQRNQDRYEWIEPDGPVLPGGIEVNIEEIYKQYWKLGCTYGPCF